jgi:hypothetical protein
MIFHPKQYQSARPRSDPTIAILGLTSGLFAFSLFAVGFSNSYIDAIVNAAAGLVIGSAYVLSTFVGLALSALKVYDRFPFTLFDGLLLALRKDFHTRSS